MVHRTSFIVNEAISCAALLAHSLGTVDTSFALQHHGFSCLAALSFVKEGFMGEAGGNAHVATAFPAALGQQ
jgi:hypothetical protein